MTTLLQILQECADEKKIENRSIFGDAMDKSYLWRTFWSTVYSGNE